MATNPRIPDNRDYDRNRGPQNVITTRKRPGSAWNGLIIGLAIVVVILGVILYFLPRAPKVARPSTGATVPAQATGAMLQIQGLQLSPSPDGRSLLVRGNISNNGSQTVTGAVMQLRFMARNGGVAGAATAPVMLVQSSGKGNKAHVTGTEAMTDAPLKPNDVRDFQVQVENVPAGWDHSMPQISFTQVASHP